MFGTVRPSTVAIAFSVFPVFPLPSTICAAPAQDVHNGPLISTCAKSAFGCKVKRRNLVEKGSRVDKSLCGSLSAMRGYRLENGAISGAINRFTVKGSSYTQRPARDPL